MPYFSNATPSVWGGAASSYRNDPPQPAINFSDNETPSGLVDGQNKAFVLAWTPIGNSLCLYQNGLMNYAGQDFSLSGRAIIFNTAPLVNSSLAAWYRY